MKRYRTFTVIGLMAALLLSACSQDELAENSTALPEGEYPLQIGSVTLTAEVSEQPWTRVAESTEGMSSVWADGDRIGVRIGDNEETGIYVMNVDAEGWVVGVTPEKPVYWKDKQPATITAWYPLNEELDFTHQNQGLTYLLKATGNGNYQSTPINLNFTHQLAKVRVKLEGTKADEVTAVTVRSYEGTNNEQGTPNGRIGTDVYVPMLKATYGDETYWEANLLKGYLDADNTFRVSSDGKNFVQAKLTTDVDITPGHVHTIKIDVGEAQPVEGEISGDGYYLVSEARNEPVAITGGSPTVYLKGASINVSDGPAISITGGTPTIYVIGEGNSVFSGNNTGIAVSGGATVTIEGSSTADVLTANGGTTGSTSSATAGAGIGSSTNGACGDITIEDAVIVATAGPCAAGIGMGCNYWNSNSPTASIGKITITDSDVTASGGYGAAAIGFSLSELFSGSGDTYRAGRITITTEDEAGFLSKLKPGMAPGFSLTPQRIGKGAYNFTPTFLNTAGTGPWEGVVINGTSYQDGVQ
ncbi:MAG: fimbrillin family protein [Bacteroidetes bacterium]|uniref:Fimbrillin family protein n=1 Tax=Candidatus Cryptobacteroides faecipullorum TaxID=2840764 RepID=A0A9D9I962_9BACT|nr:fimbrillin family protein [Candidatus Cryptobacteroides faecipullorum]